MRIRSAVKTDVGYEREHNEDSFLNLPNFGLFAVADGMGGHEAGEHASRIAIETLKSYRSRTSPPLDLLAAAFNRANIEILNSMRRHPERRGMGTTMVAMSVRGNRAYYANVGDSRLYLYRGEAVGATQITRDHTHGGHVLSSCLGSHEGAMSKLDVDVLPVVRGDVAILCSDGLSDYADADAVGRLIRRAGSDDPQRIVDILTDHALSSGGRDNITVIAVQF